MKTLQEWLNQPLYLALRGYCPGHILYVREWDNTQRAMQILKSKYSRLASTETIILDDCRVIIMLYVRAKSQQSKGLFILILGQYFLF